MLLCFSSSHRTADFDLLERLERHAPAITAALSEHSDIVSGSVVLATCNRFEAYLDIDEPLPAARAVSTEAVLDAVSSAAGIDPDLLRGASAVYSDHAVAEHLFAVTSGLESVVVGEGEIAGQVRRALESARRDGSVTSELERLFQVASRTSRGVKNRTGIMTAGRSLVRLALDLAESRISDWAQTRVLLVGTGKYAGASLAALRDRGVTDVRVYSPSGRAAKFALSHDIAPVAADGLVDALAESDLVVTCSAVTDYVLTRPILAEAVALPGAVERRLVIDLGLPRNVDPTVAELLGVELLDLETISIHAPLTELQAADDARSIVDAAAAEYRARTAEQEVTPALVALRKHVFDLLDAEIERARNRGDGSEQTEAALRHLAGVLLHTPSVRARELARQGDAQSFIDGAAAVFGVDVDAERARPRLTAVDDESAAS
ncbi:MULTISPECIES: glutamyl-tRNA reductase [unclassified Leifsonia]|uniref:glutamyl-tRNA reductase n=1 Tax=unclassified Leifsonia TaxID=2663824 RepID=UPI00037B062E|nr:MULTISPECIES: glutamyl-tRNA reductase [unclassified Leifsonia]TDQ01980.1 glutamyl-tRNA reductase [Leifsonia sp. 115AMFTsu3.1]